MSSHYLQHMPNVTVIQQMWGWHYIEDAQQKLTATVHLELSLQPSFVHSLPIYSVTAHMMCGTCTVAH